MKNQIKRSGVDEVYKGLVNLIKKELSVDMAWLARITASPQTIIELLLEITRFERCPKKRAHFASIRIEEQLINYLQVYRRMGEKERAQFSSTITGNKLFLVA